MDNKGNLKLIIMLFLVGSSSAVLLLPAVIEKESNQQHQVKGNNTQEVKLEDSLAKKIDEIKTEYIEVPINKVTETKTEITKYINNPEKIIYNQILAETDAAAELNSSKVENQATSPDAVIKITREMIDNCKIITEEYNKTIKP